MSAAWITVIYYYCTCSVYLAVTVEFLQSVFPVGEGQENVSVCLTIDMPTVTPLTVSVEATSLSADGKCVYTSPLPRG